LIAGGSFACRADDGIVDVTQLPRLAGAQDEPGSKPDRVTYAVPGIVPNTIASVTKLMAESGWMQYVRPLEDSKSSLLFKKSKQGLSISFTRAQSRADQSAVSYTAERIYSDVPFPPGSTDIVFDERRPYLGCTAPGDIEATLEFFRKDLTASGWTQLTADDAKARWPNAVLDDKPDNGTRAYYRRDDRDRQLPIMLSLQSRSGGGTSVEVRIAPFAQPRELVAGSEMAGLPKPERIKTASSTGSADSNRREMKAAIPAEIGPVLAFYRKELAARGWQEDAKDAVIKPEDISLNFTSPEATATLKIGRKYDLTMVHLVTQLSQIAIAARAKAKKEADDNFFKDAGDLAQKLIAQDETRRTAQAANLSDAPLRAQADTKTPVPLPEGAETVQFDGVAGKLEFKSSSSVKALAAFYRGALKTLGWKEEPSVINRSNMAVMEFAKGGKELSFTLMQMGPKVNVTADGSGLQAAVANVADKSATATKADQVLEPDPDAALPVPKQHTMTSLGAARLPGNETPFRRELNASVPADVGSTLAFYRKELGNRGGTESTQGAVTKPDQVRLAFTSPDGPAVLQLDGRGNETTVNLVQKNPVAAAKAGVIPARGQAKLVFGNIGNTEITVTINKQAIKVSAGVGGPQSPKGPTLELPPGKYSYTLKVEGRATRNGTIEIAADDTWGLMIAPTGEALPLQIY
jgi:hypothetical protein